MTIKTNNIIDIKSKNIDLSCTINKTIIHDLTDKKFTYLDKHLLSQARLFKNENQLSYKPKFRRYIRGSLIFVNFGICVGNELSGNHFAVVLNQNDRSSNNLLTVIPLSSKDKKNSFNLGYELLNNTLAELKIKSDKIKEVMVYVIDLLKNTKPTNRGFFLDINTIGADYILLNYNKNFNLSDNYIKYDNIDKLIELIGKDLQDFKNVIDLYAKYNKVSYAKIDQITTISKSKIIRKINNLDPMGTVTLSQDTMINIDNSISDMFFDK